MDPAVDVGLDSVREQRVEGRNREAVLRHFNKFFSRSKVAFFLNARPARDFLLIGIFVSAKTYLVASIFSLFTTTIIDQIEASGKSALRKFSCDESRNL